MNTIEKDGVIYPVLNADKKGYVTCPFCQQKFTKDGECKVHIIGAATITVNGKKENGYFVVFS